MKDGTLLIVIVICLPFWPGVLVTGRPSWKSDIQSPYQLEQDNHPPIQHHTGHRSRRKPRLHPTVQEHNSFHKVYWKLMLLRQYLEKVTRHSPPQAAGVDTSCNNLHIKVCIPTQNKIKPFLYCLVTRMFHRQSRLRNINKSLQKLIRLIEKKGLKLFNFKRKTKVTSSRYSPDATHTFPTELGKYLNAKEAMAMHHQPSSFSTARISLRVLHLHSNKQKLYSESDQSLVKAAYVNREHSVNRSKTSRFLKRIISNTRTKTGKSANMDHVRKVRLYAGPVVFGNGEFAEFVPGFQNNNDHSSQTGLHHETRSEKTSAELPSHAIHVEDILDADDKLSQEHDSVSRLGALHSSDANTTHPDREGRSGEGWADNYNGVYYYDYYQEPDERFGEPDKSEYHYEARPTDLFGPFITVPPGKEAISASESKVSNVLRFDNRI